MTVVELYCFGLMAGAFYVAVLDDAQRDLCWQHRSGIAAPTC